MDEQGEDLGQKSVEQRKSVVEQSVSEGESLFDWGVDDDTGRFKEGVEANGVVVESKPVEGMDLLTKSPEELRDEVLMKALGETEERASRYERWVEEIKAPVIDAKTLAERMDRVGGWRSYSEGELSGRSNDEIVRMIEDRRKRLGFAADGYAYLVREMRDSLAEGDTETVVAVMRTELGGVDSIKSELVAGAKKLQEERGTEAVVGLLPVYERLTARGEQSSVVEEMKKVMEPAVGYEIWKKEIEEISSFDGKWSTFRGKLSPYPAMDVLSRYGVSFKGYRGEHSPKIWEILSEGNPKKMGLGEVMAEVLTSDGAMEEVTKASVIGFAEGEREVTAEEEERVAEVLRLRLVGYMEAALTRSDGVLEGLTEYQRQHMDTLVAKPMVKMLEALAGKDRSAWQMINKDTDDVAGKARELLAKIREKEGGLLGSMKSMLEVTHRQKLEEINRREDEARRAREAEEARLAEKAKAEADKLAEERLLSGFLEEMRKTGGINEVRGVGAKIVRQIRFGMTPDYLRWIAGDLKVKKSEADKLAGEVVSQVSKMVSSVGEVGGYDKWEVKREGLRRVKVKVPTMQTVADNKRLIGKIEAKKGWEKDREKVIEWTARQVLDRWLRNAKLDMNNNPIVKK